MTERNGRLPTLEEVSAKLAELDRTDAAHEGLPFTSIAHWVGLTASPTQRESAAAKKRLTAALAEAEWIRVQIPGSGIRWFGPGREEEAEALRSQGEAAMEEIAKELRPELERLANEQIEEGLQSGDLRILLGLGPRDQSTEDEARRKAEALAYTLRQAGWFRYASEHPDPEHPGEFEVVYWWVPPGTDIRVKLPRRGKQQ